MLKSYKYAWPFIGVFLVLLATTAPILAATNVWVESDVKGVGYKNCEIEIELMIDYKSLSYLDKLEVSIEMQELAHFIGECHLGDLGDCRYDVSKIVTFLDKLRFGEHIKIIFPNQTIIQGGQIIFPEFDVEYFPITFQNHSYDSEWQEKKDYDIGFVSGIGNKWYVDDDGGADFGRIQDAIDNASFGDTIIVRDGTYEENIEVDIRLTIRSENGSDSTIVQAEYPDLPVFEVAADYVNISGFTVKGAYEDQGIDLYYANYCTISNNICSNNEDGILLMVSENNNISNNDCYLNNDSISIFLSNSNNISNNVCSDNGDDGIYLIMSNSNNISNNVCSDNGDDGIYLIMSNSNNISNNVCSDNEDYGIKLYMSENNNISDNNCPSNNCSIYLKYSANNSVSGNVCSYSSACGIFIVESTNNSISNNHWTYNFLGIGLMNSSENSIFKNNCSENDMGIFPATANNNDVYLNNFMNNDKNAGSYESSNTWSFPSKITYTYNGKTYTNYLGNYWDDYSRSDNDNDGIGDGSHRIDGNRDRYPLMEPWEKYI